MNCPHCGKEVADDATLCSGCNGEIVPPENTSGQGASAVVPEEVRGFNLGAFAFSWIWAFAHGLWLWGFIALFVPGLVWRPFLPMSFLYKVPWILNLLRAINGLFLIMGVPGFLISLLAVPLYLGIKGSELAWRKNQYQSIRYFVDRQKVWRKVGIAFLVTKYLIIPGVCAAIFIPAFLSSHDRADYTRCVETLTAIGMAEEMYITDHGHYTDKWDHLATNMIAGCTAEDGSDCPGEVYQRVSNNCNDATLKLSEDAEFWYVARGTARDKYGCKVCVTPGGYLPEKYNRKACSEWKCPGPREQEK